MRISDWSSDVCSSDLDLRGLGVEHQVIIVEMRAGDMPVEILGLEIERERIGEDAVQRFGDCLGGVGLEIGRRLQRRDRKSTRLNPVTNAHLVCRLLLENKKKKRRNNNTYVLRTAKKT